MQSFDVPMTDGRTVTAEKSDSNRWALFLFSADGEAIERLGSKSGTRGEAMRHAEQVAEHIERDPVTV